MIEIYKGWQKNLDELNRRLARFQPSMGHTSKGDVSVDARGHSLKIAFDAAACRITVQLDDSKDEVIFNRAKSALALNSAQHTAIDEDTYFEGLLQEFVRRVTGP